MTALTSEYVKAAFAEAGIKVRVRDLGIKFRICRLGDIPHDKNASLAISKQLKFTNCFGEAVGGQFNSYEMICYKEGAIIRI